MNETIRRREAGRMQVLWASLLYIISIMFLSGGVTFLNGLCRGLLPDDRDGCIKIIGGQSLHPRNITGEYFLTQRRMSRQVAGCQYGKMDMGMPRVFVINVADGISGRKQLCYAVGKLMAEVKGIPSAGWQIEGDYKMPECPWNPEFLHLAYHLEVFRQAFISRRKVECPIGTYGKVIPFRLLQPVEIRDQVVDGIDIFILF